MKEQIAELTQRLPGSVPLDDAGLHLIDLALEEDRGEGDWTTRWTVPARTRVHGTIVAKADGVIAGLGVMAAVFLRLDPRVDYDFMKSDGERVSAGDVVCTLRGPGRAVLTGERVALNFLQRLSGIATATRLYVDALEGTKTRILDTRKTTPGWRALEKAAVRSGGGDNHRAGLYDMVLIKDNHKAIAGGLREALELVQDQNTKRLPVTIEVHSLAELDAALEIGATRLLLDNFDLPTLQKAVRRAKKAKPRPTLEASGNMTLDRVRAVAETGVDFISVGALTHSSPALDLSLQIQKP
ncbi:MAG: carboxylating nicotinate-nucleotide diphosphorylase [Longimicrobiales bacterium]